MTYFVLADNALIVGVLALSWVTARRAAFRVGSSGRAPRHRNIQLYAE